MTGLVINVNYDASVASAPAGFTAVIASVVQFFENTFFDPVTITIDVGFGEIDNQALAPNSLGESQSFIRTVGYTQLRAALLSDAKTVTDAAAIASLPLADPTGGGQFWTSTAEAKALGLAGSVAAVDGFVGFSSTRTFDYDDSDGVTAGEFDFFAVVAHEFSEIMGRELGVGATTLGVPNSYRPLDLFHYAAPGVRDFSGTQPGYFSTDGGATDLANFNTIAGADFGDWADSAGNDAFRARSLPGVVDPVTAADIAALDAIGWDADDPPVVTSLNASFHGAQAIAATSLFATSDPDGNPITAYELWDPTVGNGDFTVNGIVQAARQVIDLPNLTGLAWDTTGETGSTVFAVRAFDGLEWSDWTTVTVTDTEQAPVVTGLDALAHAGRSIPSEGLFGATDPNGDPIKGFELWDPIAGNGGFTIGGAPQPARQVIDVSPAALATLSWDTTGQSGTTVFAVRATDGIEFGDWTTVAVTIGNTPPAVSQVVATAHVGQSIAAANMIFASDAENDPIAGYELWDPVAGDGGFTINGVAQDARQVIPVASLAGVAWSTTGQDGTTVFAVRATDGTQFGDWAVVTVEATDNPPIVAPLNPTVTAGQQLAAASLFQASDPDGDPITQYELWDPLAGDGDFVVGGTVEPARQVIDLSAADLAAVSWDATAQTGSTVFAVRAFDGTLWSDWTVVTANKLTQALAGVAGGAVVPLAAGPTPASGETAVPLHLAATVGHS